MTAWHVAQTEPRREAAVYRRIVQAGCETYLPLIAVSGGTAPLFPGYLMVKSDHWYATRWTPGVVRVLMAGERPAKLSDADVDQLRARERNGVIRLPQKATPRLEPGQPVRITVGNFTGLIGLYQGQRGVDRVAVLLDMLGQKVPVQLAATDITVA